LKKTFSLLILSIIYSSVFGQITKPIGINLASVTDYSTEFVFTDAFKQCREWTSSDVTDGGEWDTHILIPLNANGYPIQIPYNDGVHPPQIVKALMLWDIGDAVPQGRYRLKVAGSGEVRMVFGASGTYSCPVDTMVQVSGSVMLEIRRSEISDPISDIKFIYPNYINSYQTKTFTDEFLTFLKDFQVIRFMDFTRTNNSIVSSWSDRSPQNYYTQSLESGVSWEYIIELAILTGKDIWINIPHKADDNYLNQLATLLQNSLNGSTKIYLEYSNEVWNSIFSQNQDCAAFAQELGYTGQPWERTWKYTSKRSADIFKAFEDVFADDSRLIKIIPTQAANSWITNQLITYFNDPFYNPAQVKASAVAIAPYFSGSTADDIVTNGEVNSITLEEIIQRMVATIPQTTQWALENKVVADEYGLRLLCYEAGQHLVATGNNVNIDALTEKLNAANHHPAMQDAYCQYLDSWYDTIGDVMCHFSSHGIYSKWGSWGVKESFGDINNPKYVALQNCVFKDNKLSGKGDYLIDKLIVYPNPTNDRIIVDNNLTDLGEFKFTMYSVSGLIKLSGKSSVGHEISLSDLSPGIYFLEIQNENGIVMRKIVKI